MIYFELNNWFCFNLVENSWYQCISYYLSIRYTAGLLTERAWVEISCDCQTFAVTVVALFRQTKNNVIDVDANIK